MKSKSTTNLSAFKLRKPSTVKIRRPVSPFSHNSYTKRVANKYPKPRRVYRSSMGTNSNKHSYFKLPNLNLKGFNFVLILQILLFFLLTGGLLGMVRTVTANTINNKQETKIFDFDHNFKTNNINQNNYIRLVPSEISEQ